jgi:viroplasmin and RNaseH domain-containing protein
MFSEPGESAETKGETISFQGKEIEGSFSPVEGYENDRYRESAEFSTESAADEWLKGKLNVTAPLRNTASPSTTKSGSGDK